MRRNAPPSAVKGAKVEALCGLRDGFGLVAISAISLACDQCNQLGVRSAWRANSAICVWRVISMACDQLGVWSMSQVA